MMARTRLGAPISRVCHRAPLGPRTIAGCHTGAAPRASSAVAPCRAILHTSARTGKRQAGPAEWHPWRLVVLSPGVYNVDCLSQGKAGPLSKPAPQHHNSQRVGGQRPPVLAHLGTVEPSQSSCLSMPRARIDLRPRLACHVLRLNTGAAQWKTVSPAANEAPES